LILQADLIADVTKLSIK